MSATGPAGTTCAGRYTIDLTERFLDLLRATRAAGLVVLLSSWEYQQCAALARSSRWFDAIASVPMAERYWFLARAWDRLLEEVTRRGLREEIALLELHNEFDSSMLPPIEAAMPAVTWLSRRHPDVPITVS